MDKLIYPENPSLVELQRYVKDMTRERGFDNETVAQQFLLLLEECGELARGARKSAGIAFAKDTSTSEVADEAADVLLMLLAICNKLGVDLEQAVRNKEAKNSQREWK